jgi:hypothetical protein
VILALIIAISLVPTNSFQAALLKLGFFSKQFSETPHELQFHPTFKWYNRNHAHFLLKATVKTVLEFNCINECAEKYQNQEDYKQLDVTHFDENKQNLNNNTYDWVVIRSNTNNQKQVLSYVQRFTRNAKKGVTLIFNNLQEYRKFKDYHKDRVEELMNSYKFEYDEMISLNLRRREGKVLLVFSTEVKRSTFPFKKPIKNQIGIQLEIKLNENLPFMR